MTEEKKELPTTVGELLSDVKFVIDRSTGRVVARVLEELAETEVDARKSSLLAAVKKYEELRRDGRKLEKPDVETFDIDGKVITSHFTKERAEQLKKHREQLDKVEKAIAKAFEGDFSKLKELK